MTAEFIGPSVDTVADTISETVGPSYMQNLANPLMDEYSRRECALEPDLELTQVITSLDAHTLEIKDISDKHIYHALMGMMSLGVDMIEKDIKPGTITPEILAERSKSGFFAWSTIAWLEVTRRRHQGAIDATSLFRAAETVFRDKFSKIFTEPPLEERLDMFNRGRMQAWAMVHEHGFTVIGG